MALFTFLNGCIFISVVNAMRSSAFSYSLVHNFFTAPWFWIAVFFLFPLITMRLFAEEKKMGTYEGLMTAPVRTVEVLLAKYAAAFTVYLAMLVPLFLFFPVFKIVTGQEEAFHNGAVWSSGWFFVLIGAFNTAIGTLASSITANQLIAAMVTFVGVVLHYFIGFIGKFMDLPNSGWQSLLSYFSSIDHAQLMSQGLIDSRPFVYYLTFSALLLAVTWHILESRKWRL